MSCYRSGGAAPGSAGAARPVLRARARVEFDVVGTEPVEQPSALAEQDRGQVDLHWAAASGDQLCEWALSYAEAVGLSRMIARTRSPRAVSAATPTSAQVAPAAAYGAGSDPGSRATAMS
jgi:hypothetical protein